MSKNNLDQLNLATLDEEQLAALKQAEAALNRGNKKRVYLMALCD